MHDVDQIAPLHLAEMPWLGRLKEHLGVRLRPIARRNVEGACNTPEHPAPT